MGNKILNGVRQVNGGEARKGGGIRSASSCSVSGFAVCDRPQSRAVVRMLL